MGSQVEKLLMLIQKRQMFPVDGADQKARSSTLSVARPRYLAQPENEQ
jgi:hypothetical protein